MFALIKKIFIGLLTGLVDASDHTKYVLLSNQERMESTKLIRTMKQKIF